MGDQKKMMTGEYKRPKCDDVIDIQPLIGCFLNKMYFINNIINIIENVLNSSTSWVDVYPCWMDEKMHTNYTYCAEHDQIRRNNCKD